MWGIGAQIGWFAANGNWSHPTVGPQGQVWGGFHGDLRVSIFEYLGLWLRVGVWLGERTAVPIEHREHRCGAAPWAPTWSACRTAIRRSGSSSSSSTTTRAAPGAPRIPTSPASPSACASTAASRGVRFRAVIGQEQTPQGGLDDVTYIGALELVL
ncbi:MAG: hypothetical protein M3Y87_29110 [Myxococcota bacterium]|nr:hypothetical protein [Myxococcota bacterium]